VAEILSSVSTLTKRTKSNINLEMESTSLLGYILLRTKVPPDKQCPGINMEEEEIKPSTLCQVCISCQIMALFSLSVPLLHK
jgi:hypothetical protein